MHPDRSAPANSSFSRSAWNWIFALLRDLTVSVVLALVVIFFFYRPVKVEGTSMMPSLVDQERIFINQFVYRLGPIGRGDTVVFWFPGDPRKSYIKRVIGTPGDVVEIERGTVYVNGQQLHELYVPDEYRDAFSMDAKKVGPDEYFVMGDHRISSSDSRVWGTVPRRYIYGKAVLSYWPLERFGLVE